MVATICGCKSVVRATHRYHHMTGNSEPTDFQRILLRHHLGGALQPAFDRTNSHFERLIAGGEATNGEHPYHHRAFERWLDGHRPKRQPFIEKLADELDDLELVDAYRKLGDQRDRDRHHDNLIESFRSLAPASQADVFNRIEHIYLANGYTRRNFSAHATMGVAPNRPGFEQVAHLTVDLQWQGRLPAEPSIVITNSRNHLDTAYSDSDCIYREFVAIDDSGFDDPAELFATAEAALHYRTPDDTTYHVAEVTEQRSTAGVRWSFRAQDHDDALVRVRARCPFPRTPPYLFRLGHYTVTGDVAIGMRVDLPDAAITAFDFLGPGVVPALRAFGGNELTLEVDGHQVSHIMPRSGVVFFW